MNKSVLITGATGGLGLALTEAFCQAGYTVTATGRSNRHANRFKTLRARFIPADLTKVEDLPSLCAGQNIVIHAAALSSSWGEKTTFERINVTATQNLLAQAKHAGVESFVFISSPSISTAMKDQINQKEDIAAIHQPLNDYARTKLLAERLVLAADSPSFKTIALRPRALIGPDDQVLLPQLMALIRKERLPLLRKGKACIDLTDVRDAAKATLLAVENIERAHGRFFHISGGTSINMKELTQEIAKICSINIYFFPCPLFLAKLIAYISEKLALTIKRHQEPFLTRYKLATLAYSQTFDLTAAKNELGYQPSHNARETLLYIIRERHHEALQS